MRYKFSTGSDKITMLIFLKQFSTLIMFYHKHHCAFFVWFLTNKLMRASKVYVKLGKIMCNSCNCKLLWWFKINQGRKFLCMQFGWDFFLMYLFSSIHHMLAAGLDLITWTKFNQDKFLTVYTYIIDIIISLIYCRIYHDKWKERRKILVKPKLSFWWYIMTFESSACVWARVKVVKVPEAIILNKNKWNIL